MTITGSYARGTIQSINPNLEIGVFPLPNDTYDDTKCLSGIDAAICVSAQASDKEKDAAYRFLSYLADPENAQIFCDNDGAPSCITGVTSNDDGSTTVRYRLMPEKHMTGWRLQLITM